MWQIILNPLSGVLVFVCHPAHACTAFYGFLIFIFFRGLRATHGNIILSLRYFTCWCWCARGSGQRLHSSTQQIRMLEKRFLYVQAPRRTGWEEESRRNGFVEPPNRLAFTRTLLNPTHLFLGAHIIIGSSFLYCYSTPQAFVCLFNWQKRRLRRRRACWMLVEEQEEVK